MKKIFDTAGISVSEIIDRYGMQHQIDKAIEEMAELTHSMLQHRYGRIESDVVAGEIADVLIMMEQMIKVFTANGQVEQHCVQKLIRLKGRMKDGFNG